MAERIPLTELDVWKSYHWI